MDKFRGNRGGDPLSLNNADEVCMNCGYTKAGHVWEPGEGFACGNVGRTQAGAGGRLDQAVGWGAYGVIAPPTLSPLSRRYKAIMAREEKAQEERREREADRLKEQRRLLIEEERRIQATAAAAMAAAGQQLEEAEYRFWMNSEPNRPDAKERLKRERRELPPAGASRSYFDEG